MSEFNVYLEKDGDDLILPIPPELMKKMGWEIGDDLIFEIAENEIITVRKKIA